MPTELNTLAMNFLNRLWTTLTGCFRAATSPKLSLDALLNRYLTHKNQFSVIRVKQNAFLPRNLKLSVFLTDGLSSDQIWILPSTALYLPVWKTNSLC